MANGEEEFSSFVVSDQLRWCQRQSRSWVSCTWKAYLDAIPRGAYAEYAGVSEWVACLKPDNMFYEQAAAVPLAATTALQALRDLGQILPGHQVLINGASGGVGSFAVQIAKAFKAEVTAVCGTRNVEMVQSLGADRILDYTAQDFTKDTNTYDIIFDAVGKQSLGHRTLAKAVIIYLLLPYLARSLNLSSYIEYS